MSKKNKIRWGIIGTGFIAGKISRTLSLLDKEAEKTAVLSRNKERGEKFAKENQIKNVFTSLGEFLSSGLIDVVYVATPHHLHRDLVISSLQNNIHVLCEKPIGINEHEVLEMAELASKNNLFLMEAMWSQYIPAMKALQKIIHNGAIGNVRFINASFCFNTNSSDQDRLLNPELAGGALLDVGIYCIYFAQMIINQYPKSISGEAYFGKTGVDEQNAVILKYNEGQLAVLTSAIKTQTSRKATIYGTNGYIEVDDFVIPQKLEVFSKNGKKEKLNYKIKGNGYVYELMEVNNCIKHNKLQSHIISHARSIEIVKIMDTLRKNWNFNYPTEHRL